MAPSRGDVLAIEGRAGRARRATPRKRRTALTPSIVVVSRTSHRSTPASSIAVTSWPWPWRRWPTPMPPTSTAAHPRPTRPAGLLTSAAGRGCPSPCFRRCTRGRTRPAADCGRPWSPAQNRFPGDEENPRRESKRWGHRATPWRGPGRSAPHDQVATRARGQVLAQVTPRAMSTVRGWDTRSGRPGGKGPGGSLVPDRADERARPSAQYDARRLSFRRRAGVASERSRHQPQHDAYARLPAPPVLPQTPSHQLHGGQTGRGVLVGGEVGFGGLAVVGDAQGSFDVARQPEPGEAVLEGGSGFVD